MSAVFWMGPDGKTAPLRNVPGKYGDIRLSPEGRRLAMELLDGSGLNIWVYEWQRDTMFRLTLNPVGSSPVWTPDGSRITFCSDRANQGIPNIYWQRADGTGELQRLTESPNWHWPKSWHPSGKFLAFEEQNPRTLFYHTMILPMERVGTVDWKAGKPFPLLDNPDEGMPMFSPDGHWLAYWSAESGTRQVYVRRFPGPGGKWQISTDGGVFPTWSPNGRELFYQEEDGKIMVAGYTASGAAFRTERPRVWSPVTVPLSGDNRSIDVSHPYDGHLLAALFQDITVLVYVCARTSRRRKQRHGDEKAHSH